MKEITAKDMERAMNILRKHAIPPKDILFYAYCPACNGLHIFHKKSPPKCKKALIKEYEQALKQLRQSN